MLWVVAILIVVGGVAAYKAFVAPTIHGSGPPPGPDVTEVRQFEDEDGAGAPINLGPHDTWSVVDADGPIYKITRRNAVGRETGADYRYQGQNYSNLEGARAAREEYQDVSSVWVGPRTKVPTPVPIPAQWQRTAADPEVMRQAVADFDLAQRFAAWCSEAAGVTGRNALRNGETRDRGWSTFMYLDDPTVRVFGSWFAVGRLTATDFALVQGVEEMSQFNWNRYLEDVFRPGVAGGSIGVDMINTLTVLPEEWRPEREALPDLEEARRDRPVGFKRDPLLGGGLGK